MSLWEGCRARSIPYGDDVNSGLYLEGRRSYPLLPVCIHKSPDVLWTRRLVTTPG